MRIIVVFVWYALCSHTTFSYTTLCGHQTCFSFRVHVEITIIMLIPAVCNTPRSRDKCIVTNQRFSTVGRYWTKISAMKSVVVFFFIRYVIDDPCNESEDLATAIKIKLIIRPGTHDDVGNKCFFFSMKFSSILEIFSIRIVSTLRATLL